LRERSFISPHGRPAVTGATTPIGFARSSEQASLSDVGGRLRLVGEHLLDLAAVSPQTQSSCPGRASGGPKPNGG